MTKGRSSGGFLFLVLTFAGIRDWVSAMPQKPKTKTKRGPASARCAFPPRKLVQWRMNFW